MKKKDILLFISLSPLLTLTILVGVFTIAAIINYVLKIPFNLDPVELILRVLIDYTFIAAVYISPIALLLFLYEKFIRANKKAVLLSHK